MKRLAPLLLLLTTTVACSESNESAVPVVGEDPASFYVETTEPPTTTTRPVRTTRAARTEVRRIPLARPSGSASLEAIKRCESGGNYHAVSRSGRHMGAYQFDQKTWNGAVARAGYPEYAGTPPNQAPANVQDAAARQLQKERGNQPWPTCGRR